MIDGDLARRLKAAARKVVRLREATTQRDDLIVEALQSGASQREVALLVDLTQPAISGIWQRHIETTAGAD